jgi:O-antigen ligase
MPLTRAAVIVWLILGVPIVFSAYVLAGVDNAVIVFAGLGLVAYGTVLLDLGHLVTRSTHRLYYAFFAVLTLSTLLIGFGGTGDLQKQLVAVIDCLLWTSVFISLFFVVRRQSDLVFAIRVLDITGVLIAITVYASAVMHAAFGVAFGETVDIYGQFRAFGPLGDQVGFALVLFAIRSAAKGRWLLFAVSVGAVLLTATRGAVFALMVGIVVLVVLKLMDQSGDSSGGRRRVPAILVLGILLIAFFASPLAGSAYRQLTERSRGTVTAREEPIRLGLKLFRANPLLGAGFLDIGPSAANLGAPQAVRAVVGGRSQTYSAENQFAETAADAGIVGLLLLLMLLVTLVRNVDFARRSAVGPWRAEFLSFEAALLAIFLGNQSAVWILPSATSGYFVFVIAALSERACSFGLGRESQLDRPTTAGGRARRNRE